MSHPRGPDFQADLILVCGSLEAGGIARVVSTLANEWSRRGRKISVITLADRPMFYALDAAVHHVAMEQGTPWLALPLRSGRACLTHLGRARPFLIAVLGSPVYSLLANAVHRARLLGTLTLRAAALRRALKRIESPIVVAFGTGFNVTTLKACRGLERRVVISERTDPATWIDLWQELGRKYYKQAHLVTANTQSALRDIGAFVGTDKLAFAPNPLRMADGSDPNGKGPLPLSHSPAPLILNVGQLVPEKAQEVLLEAFALLGDDLCDWRLAVLGNGTLEEDLHSRAARLGIEERVDWHGVVADPYSFYRMASIFALPSRIEGTPNALLEAMSCGLPVVISDGAPGPLELIEDGQTGLVVPVNDPVALAAALRRLAQDEPLRLRLGAAARERVTEYDVPLALAKWESVVGLTC